MPPPLPIDPRLRCDPPQTTLFVEIEDGHEPDLKVSNWNQTNAASLFHFFLHAQRSTNVQPIICKEQSCPNHPLHNEPSLPMVLQIPRTKVSVCLVLTELV